MKTLGHCQKPRSALHRKGHPEGVRNVRTAFRVPFVAFGTFSEKGAGTQGGAGRYVVRSPVSPSSGTGVPPSPPGGRLLRQSLVVRDSADFLVRLRSRTEKIRTAEGSLPPGGEGGAKRRMRAKSANAPRNAHRPPNPATVTKESLFSDKIKKRCNLREKNTTISVR